MQRISILTLPIWVIILIISSCTSEQLKPRFDCSVSPVSLQLVEKTISECNSATGSLTVVASGGEGAFEYVLGNQRNQDGIFVGLSAGQYNVQATDINGCLGELVITIENIEGVNLTGVQVTEAGCGTQNGSIDISASGGLEPYIFTINNGTPQASGQFSNLGTGNYNISVKDQSGCETTTSTKILSGVSYENSVKNIIAFNCAISGCHNGSRSPDLRSFSNIQANASSIKSRTANRSMPQGRTLSQQQIDLIACWVDDGALEN